MRIKHKGLRRFIATGTTRGIPPILEGRIRRILRSLDQARSGNDLRGFYGAHPLRGDRAGEWSFRVSANWRIVCRFDGGKAVDVDLIDYH